MDAEQAWQSALGQLQREMPKGSFDTWVRDTRVVSYEDGRFVIGGSTLYARDWLESRLSSTANRLLMGMMNRAVEVEFVVANAELAADGDEVFVEGRYDLAYDEVVVPDHVTLVSRYFLRHLRLIGPDLGWLYMGFRQAAFNAGARRGSQRERLSGNRVAALSGITRRTFCNRIGNAETWEQLKGLVTTAGDSPEWDASSSNPRRLPRKYVVSMTLPLTAADARSLRAWLTTNLEGWGGPEEVLTAAAETPLDELLPQGAQAQAGDSPESVPSIVRSLFADRLPPERLTTLSTRLHKHIMPEKDLLGTTHFFIGHVLPHLGSGPGWMLTLLRDRCYYNPETGETRNQVTVPGGYAEIAGAMGLSRPMTVYEWLYGKQGKGAQEPGKFKHPVTRVYLRETTEGKASSFAMSPRSFEVLRQEIPEEILEAAQQEWGSQALPRLLAGQGSIGLARLADDHRAVCTPTFVRFAENLGAVCKR